MKKKDYKDRMITGPKAETPRGFARNIKVMHHAGYDYKRAVGAAYGEAYLGIDKMERRKRK